MPALSGALAGHAIEQQLQADVRQLLDGLGDRGQSDAVHARHAGAVETDDRDVFGDAPAACFQLLDQRDRDVVVGGDDRLRQASR